MEQLHKDPASPKQRVSVLPVVPVNIGRRWFMRYVGVTAAGGVLLSSCAQENLNPITGPGETSMRGGRAGDVVELGSGDIGVLNYAYALEQAELRFLELVLDTRYDGMSTKEFQVFKDLRDQEITHVDFFEAVLGSFAIPKLTLDYSSVNFRNRDSVLTTARNFADLATAAYNGAGQLLTDANNLATAGKIVSVEARHASVIRELIAPGSTYFAGDDVVDPATGLDPAKMPGEVLPVAQQFIKEIISASRLPMA
ncbi:hypothetical protein BN8_02433 [Fibrisoma limi BUZ 3]|uniref:Ferritin-like domain-containing protein n=1 Tax=Fibrisoma limi BUZ 3 TaxID=1185876 RepID=I2GHG8_9BACT|nr:ferritin-like domain-containing protein [Fibrisoma limi]CCH53343.1 hypothetical protein BN8_02433 [Fibrisoma limi BUZ 3]